jgi:transcriptional regulator with XRE-family HTH domain
MNEQIGREIKRIRTKYNFSLRDLAGKIECSPSYLSQVENGKVSPSLSSLVRIADALGTTIQQLFEEMMRPEENPVIRQTERRRIDSINTGVQASFLTNAILSRHFEVAQISLDPGASTGEDGVYKRSGSQLMVVLQGRVRVTLGDSDYELAEGDSLNMVSRAPHYVKNTAEGSSQLLFIVVPHAR